MAVGSARHGEDLSADVLTSESGSAFQRHVILFSDRSDGLASHGSIIFPEDYICKTALQFAILTVASENARFVLMGGREIFEPSR